MKTSFIKVPMEEPKENFNLEKRSKKEKRQLNINTGNRIKQLHEENGLRPRNNKLGWGRIMRKQKAQN